MGATASGKSELALALARRLGDVEVVSVDSMQVYRGMDIGTSKPTPKERAEVPHHLLDLADPSEEWTLVEWLGAARSALGEIEARGHRALLVGGTGLYFHTLVDGLAIPGRYPEVAAELDAEADTAALYRRLVEVDAEGASRMEPANRRRVLRALEVTLGSGRPFSSYGPGVAAFPPTPWRIAGLWMPRPQNAARIEARFDAMLAAGLVAEVADLAARPGGLSRTARQAIGYKELLAHVQGGEPLDVAAKEATARTRELARRQRRWWRRDPRIAWYGVEKPLAAEAPLLGEWSQR